MDCSLPGSSVHGIFPARVLDWVAISFSRESSQLRDRIRVICIVGRCFIVWATREVRLQCRKPWFDSRVGKIPWRKYRDTPPVFLGFPCGSAVKNLPAMWETWVWSLGWEDPLEKGKATHSSIPAWRIPGLYSPWGHKKSDTTERLSLTHLAITPVNKQFWPDFSTKTIQKTVIGETFLEFQTIGIFCFSVSSIWSGKVNRSIKQVLNY